MNAGASPAPYLGTMFGGMTAKRGISMDLVESAGGAAGSPRWRKSSRCDSASCVEVATFADAVAVRDSKVSDGPILWFSPEEWSAFVAGVRVGDFDI